MPKELDPKSPKPPEEDVDIAIIEGVFDEMGKILAEKGKKKKSKAAELKEAG